MSRGSIGKHEIWNHYPEATIPRALACVSCILWVIEEKGKKVTAEHTNKVKE